MAKKILIIEDEAIQALALKAYLETAGFDVLTALTGEDGLTKALEHKPDVVLLDLVLPGRSGLDVCQQLKDTPQTMETLVILVTASTTRGLEDRCKIFGADGCLIKPCEPSEVLERIHELLATKTQSLA